MTARKAAYRPRRGTAGGGIPRDLVDWFEGKPNANGHPVPWSALLAPWHALLGVYWRTWAADHPSAAPPAGWEWIADPNSPRHAPEWQRAAALKMIANPGMPPKGQRRST